MRKIAKLAEEAIANPDVVGRNLAIIVAIANEVAEKKNQAHYAWKRKQKAKKEQTFNELVRMANAAGTL